jgi:carboxypeptidase PM20D1
MPASLAGTTSLFLDSLAPEMSFPGRVLLTNRWLFGPLLIAGFARLEPLDARVRTTTAVTIFESGVKENVLPVRARAVVNFRIHPNDSIDSVVEHARDSIDDERVELQVGVRSPPRQPSPVSSVDSQAYLDLSKTIRSVFPGTAVVPYLVVGGTDARHYYRLTDNVYRFGPFIYGPETLRLAHGTNERISVDNLVRGVQFFVERIRSGAGAAPGVASSR